MIGNCRLATGDRCLEIGGWRLAAGDRRLEWLPIIRGVLKRLPFLYLCTRGGFIGHKGARANNFTLLPPWPTKHQSRSLHVIASFPGLCARMSLGTRLCTLLSFKVSLTGETGFKLCKHFTYDVPKTRDWA